MSYSPPKVFISATAAGLRSVRDAITEALTSIGCVPVEVASFEPDCTTVAGALREKIESCQALIHIAGERYGPEPDPATVPAGTPRRSYAQMEYHIACEAKEQRGDGDFWMYVFVCPEDFPYDPAPGIEISEKWSLQDAHRKQLLKSPHYCGSPESVEDMRSWALGLQKQFPPPPPPPPPPPEAPPPMTTLAQEGEPPADRPPDLANTPVAAASAKRPRILLVFGIMAAIGFVAILAAAWMLHRQGFFGRKVVLPKKPEIKAVQTAKADSGGSPAPKVSKPIPTPAPVPPPPQAPPPTPPAPPTPTPAVTEKSTSSTTPPPTPPQSPTPSPSPSPARPKTTEIDLVRRAAVGLNPASKLTAAEIGKLYVEQPVLNGKTFTRADIIRQVEQFRSNWDTQTYEILEGPTVTSGEGSNHLTVKVKTRFVGVRKTGIKFSNVVVTTEFVVLVGADGTPLVESQHELSQEQQ